MKTFKKFLITEALEEILEQDEFIKLLNINCSEYLSMNIKQPIYHGLSRFAEYGTNKGISQIKFGIRTIRKDRQPKDSDQYVHDFINYVFEKLGFKTNRSNCLFVTGDKEQAEQYGTVFEAYPTNGFSFLWSPKIKDFTEDLFLKFTDEMIYDGTIKNFAEFDQYSFAIQSAILGNINKIIRYYFEKNKKDTYEWFKNRFASTSSIDRNYIIEQITKRRFDEVFDIKKLNDHFGYIDQNLKEAIRSGNEIMISGDAVYLKIYGI